jgi:hypothetical protein
MEFDDPRWTELRSGYRDLYDPRPDLRLLESGCDDKTAWDSLWQNLHHQGDVDLASYASVPHLVRIYARRFNADWNAYSMVTIIDECRRAAGKNPPLPEWLRPEYEAAISKLGELALLDLAKAHDQLLIDTAIAAVATSKGHYFLARLAGQFTEEERLEFLRKVGFA